MTAQTFETKPVLPFFIDNLDQARSSAALYIG